jgi:hypothetical protein
VFHDFAGAKAYVLKRRDELRASWEQQRASLHRA